MINAFLLGLGNKGREIAHEILSDTRYSGVQAQTIFFIAEKFLIDGIREDDYDAYTRAYKFYSMLIDGFPESEYTGSAVHRKTYIETIVGSDRIYALFDYWYSAEVEIILSKLDVAGLFLKIHPPNPYEIFAESRYNQDGVTIMNKYLSDIMINHPFFEPFGYYQKILIQIDAFGDIETISEGIAPLDRKKVSMQVSALRYNKQKNDVYLLLDEMSDKYPSHPLTLDLHLLFGKLFMERSRGRIDMQTLNHLQFVLENDPDQLSPRYLLAREFIENNSFQGE
jgi:hypothetical protein